VDDAETTSSGSALRILVRMMVMMVMVMVVVVVVGLGKRITRSTHRLCEYNGELTIK